MNEDYMPVRLDLPDDEAVHQIAEQLGLDPDLVVGKLIRVWRWAQKNSADGNLKVGVKTLDFEARCKGFAKAMADAGWLLIDDDGVTIPNYHKWNAKAAKKRLQDRDRMRDVRATTLEQNANKCSNGTATKSEQPFDQQSEEQSILISEDQRIRVPLAADPADQIRVSAEECKHLAADAFRRSGYRGQDGSVFWRAAALVVSGHVPAAAFNDAADGCRVKSPKNIPGYFRRSLANAVANAESLLTRVWLEPRCPKGPPSQPEPITVPNLRHNRTESTE